MNEPTKREAVLSRALEGTRTFRSCFSLSFTILLIVGSVAPVSVNATHGTPSAGVKPGDVVTYSFFFLDLSTTMPTLVSGSLTVEVLSVVGTVVTFAFTFTFTVNGVTETFTGTISQDVLEGIVTDLFPGPFQAANLTEGESVWVARATPEGSQVIEFVEIMETINRTYGGSTREVNHIQETGPYSGDPTVTLTLDGFWDRVSGVLVEMRVTVVETGEVGALFVIEETNIWTSDTIAPDTSIISSIDGNLKSVPNGGITLSDSISLTFAGTDNVEVAGFECSLDGSAFSACTSPANHASLSIGSHGFQVRAIDSSNNVDLSPATFSWTVESPPDTSIVSVLGGTTRLPFIGFIFAGTDNIGVQSFECSLDGAAFTSCSSPVFYRVTRGVHTFQVRAIDTEGFADPTPAVFTWRRR